MHTPNSTRDISEDVDDTSAYNIQTDQEDAATDDLEYTTNDALAGANDHVNVAAVEAGKPI